MKRFLILFFLLGASAAYADDLRLSGKAIEFYLNPEMGAFYAEDPNPATPAYRTLLFSDNPPTSYLTLVVDGKPYRLNDHSLTTVEGFHEENDRITGVFSIGNVFLRVVFQITNSANAQNDTVLCYVAAKNRRDTAASVGARFLFDTFYDERWGKPSVYTSSGDPIKTERLLYPENFPNFVFCGDYDSDKGFTNGLFIYPYLNDLKPAFIIVGNWKKLDENEWDYPIDPRSDFRYNSYANKDAATAIYFDKIEVNPGEEINFGTVISRSDFRFSQYVAGRYVANLVNAVVENTPPIVTNAVVQSATNVASTVQVTQTVVVTPPVPTNAQVAVRLPATNVVTVFVTNDMTPSTVSNVGEIELMRLQLEMLDRLTTIIEKMDNRLTTVQTVTNLSQRMVTNVVTNSAAVDEMKRQYDEQLDAQREQYEEKLDNQAREFQYQLDTTQRELQRNSSDEVRSASIQQLDTMISELDQKIKLIEQLERMNLDFETMPESELRRLNDQIDAIEHRALRTQGR